MGTLALVTGASSGIGRAFAERLADRGHDLVIVGRRADRLQQFASAHPEVSVRPIAADLSTDAGIDAVARVCASEPVSMLVNNAGVAHYMPLAELPAEKARELVGVKTLAPTMLTRAAIGGMQERGEGAVITVAGMIAFSGPALSSVMPCRAVYAGGLAFAVAMSQTLAAELAGTGVRVQVVCPGVVATEFHERQGMDLSAVPRMSAADVGDGEPARSGDRGGRGGAGRGGHHAAGRGVRRRPGGLRRPEPAAGHALPHPLTRCSGRCCRPAACSTRWPPPPAAPGVGSARAPPRCPVTCRPSSSSRGEPARSRGKVASRHVEVFPVGGVSTPILGRPRSRL